MSEYLFLEHECSRIMADASTGVVGPRYTCMLFWESLRGKGIRSILAMLHRQESSSVPFRFRRTYLKEAFLLSVVILFSTWLGWRSMSEHDDTLLLDSQNLLSFMEQSVLFAAGLGMGRTACLDEEFPLLSPFLASEITEIPSDAYPEQCSDVYNPDPFFEMHYGLFYYVGIVFRLFGVSTRSFHLACLLLYVTAMIAVYGLFRLVLTPLAATAVALVIASAPAFLAMAPSLRDFGKTPFILAALFFIGMLLQKQRSQKQVVVLSILCGAVIGLGYGFRQDVIVCLPPALFIVLAGASPPHSRFLRWRIVAALALLCAFSLAALPALRTDRAAPGATSAHTLIQGIMTHAEENAGLYSVDYDFGSASFDPVVIASINAYAQRTGHTYPAMYMTQAYGDSGRRLFRDVAVTFPADMVKRGLMSVLGLGAVLEDAQILNILPNGDEQAEAVAPTIQRLRKIQRPLSRHFATYGAVYIFAGIAAAAAASYRQAFLLAFLVFYFGAYPSLLFEFRHYFHLVVIPLFLASVFLVALLRAVRLLTRSLLQGAPAFKSAIVRVMRGCARGVVCVALLLTVIFIVLAFLTMLQASQGRRLAAAYDNAVLTPAPYTLEQRPDQVTLKVAPATDGAQLEISHVAPAYVALRFRAATRTVTFRLHNTNPAFERSCSVTLRGGGVYFFPVYNFGWETPATVTGMTMNTWDYELLEGVYLFSAPDDLRLWPYIHVPDAHESLLPFKTTALDGVLRMARIEIATLFGLRREAALSQYAQSLWQYQQLEFFVARALHHAYRGENVETVAKVWKAVGDYVISERPRASQWFARTAQDALQSERYALAARLADMGRDMLPGDMRHAALLGNVMERQRKYEAARNVYAEIALHAPESRDAYVRLLALHEMIDIVDEARSLFQEIADRYPDAVTPRLYLGMTLERMDSYDEAVDAYNMVLSRDEDNAVALFHLGALRMTRGEAADGIALARRAVSVDGSLRNEVAERCAAIAAEYRGRKNYDNAVALYAAASEIAPDKPGYKMLLADALEQRSDGDEARSIYKNMLRETPDNVPCARKLDALFTKSGATEAAVAFFQELRDQHPRSAIAWLFLGVNLERQDALDAAAAAYEKALQIGEHAHLVWYRLAALHLLQGDMESGRALLMRYSDLDDAPLHEIAQRCDEIGVWYEMREDYQSALQVYDIVRLLAPDDMRNLLRLAEIYEKKNDVETALQWYKRVLSRDPDLSYAAIRLDAIYNQAHDSAGAIAFLEQIVESHPEAVAPRVFLGMNHERLGNLDAAARWYEESLALQPDNARALYRLGALRILSENVELGIGMLRNAAALDDGLTGEISERCGEVARHFIERDMMPVARKVSKLALEIAPGDLWHKVRLGEIAESAGNTKEAATIYREILTNAPESPVTAENLDSLLQRAYDAPGMRVEVWSDIAERHPSAAIPLFYLGLAFESAGNVQSAIDAYTRVLEQRPDWEKARQRLVSLHETAMPETP